MKISRIVSIVLCFGTVTISFLLFICYGSVPMNEFRRYQVARNFDLLKHPPESVSVLKYSEVSDYELDMCSFLVGELRRSIASHEEIRSFYASSTMSSFDGKSYPLEVYFGKDTHYEVADKIIGKLVSYETQPVARWWRKSGFATSTKDLYMIFSHVRGYSSNFDIRCEM